MLIAMVILTGLFMLIQSERAKQNVFILFWIAAVMEGVLWIL